MKVRSLNSDGGGGCCGKGRRFSISFLLSLGMLSFFLSILFFGESVEGKVRCYVCAWHSPVYGGIENMTDTCSHYNFDETYTKTIECEDGCEAVSVRKSKNDKIVNFFKNCKSASKSKSGSKDGGCTSMENEQYHYVTTCECSSDFCNAGERRSSQIVGECLLLIVALILPCALFKLM